MAILGRATVLALINFIILQRLKIFLKPAHIFILAHHHFPTNSTQALNVCLFTRSTEPHISTT